MNNRTEKLKTLCMELERTNIMDKNHVFMWTCSPKQHGGVSPKPAGVVEKEVTQASPPSHGGQKGKTRASSQKGKPRASPSKG